MGLTIAERSFTVFNYSDQESVKISTLLSIVSTGYDRPPEKAKLTRIFPENLKITKNPWVKIIHGFTEKLNRNQASASDRISQRSVA
jgi:hypothetical protein